MKRKLWTKDYISCFLWLLFPAFWDAVIENPTHSGVEWDCSYTFISYIFKGLLADAQNFLMVGAGELVFLSMKALQFIFFNVLFLYSSFQLLSLSPCCYFTSFSLKQCTSLESMRIQSKAIKNMAMEH